jgi:MutS domain V
MKRYMMLIFAVLALVKPYDVYSADNHNHHASNSLRSFLIGAIPLIPLAAYSYFTFNNNENPLVRELTQEESTGIYNNVASFLPLSRLKNRVIFDENVATDLEIDRLAATLCRTKTTAGKQQFINMVKHPITDPQELAQRKEFLEELDTNPQLFDQLNRIVQEISTLEKHLLHHFDLQSSVLQQMMGKGPTDAFFENLLYLCELFNLPGSLVLSQFALIIKENFTVKWTILLHALNSYVQLSLLDFHIHDIKHNIKELPETPWRSKLGHTLHIAGHCYEVFLGYLSASNVFNAPKAVHRLDKHVVDVGNAIALLSALSEIISESPALSKTAAGQRLINFFDDTTYKPKDVDNLLSALMNRLLVQHGSGPINTVLRWNEMGNSMSTYALLQRAKYTIAQLLAAVGTIDVYLSIIRLKKEYEQNGIPTTFVEFTTDDTITLVNAHNPLVNPATSVGNSFYLGSDKNRHAMITGPHGCGKTTFAKTLILTTYIGQVFTWVLAEYAAYSLVTGIGSYCDVIQRDEFSSFMAEEERVQKLKKISETIDRKGHFLVLADEMYAKTPQSVGEPLAYEALQILGAVPGLRLFATTHFEQPTKLEAETNGLFKNYQPKLKETLPGTFEIPYEIEEGIPAWWFENNDKIDGLGGKRTRFISWLRAKTAQKMAALLKAFPVI